MLNVLPASGPGVCVCRYAVVDACCTTEPNVPNEPIMCCSHRPRPLYGASAFTPPAAPQLVTTRRDVRWYRPPPRRPTPVTVFFTIFIDSLLNSRKWVGVWKVP